MGTPRYKKENERTQRLQRLAQHNPLLYRLLVLFFVAIGYAYLALLISLFLVSVAGVGLAAWFLINSYEDSGFQGAIWLLYLLLPVLIATLLSVFSALKTEPEVPRGLILRENDAPALFQLIEAMRTSLRVRKIHRVLLTESYNAGVAVKPRLSGIAGTRIYLAIGLPLLQSLSPEEFQAVLAHELGHVSGGLNRFRQWLLLVHNRWMAIHSGVLRSSASGTFLFSIFLRWYIPHLNTVMFSMLRAVEFEADRISTQLLGGKLNAAALIGVSTRGCHIQYQFWPEIYQRVAMQVQPDEDIFFQTRLLFQKKLAPNLELGWLQWELSHLPGFRETHPTLSERLQAIRKFDELPDETCELLELKAAGDDVSAAYYYLGAAEEELTRVLSMHWKSALALHWRDEFNNASVRQSYMDEMLRKRKRGEKIDEHDLRQLCRLVEEFEGRRAAFPYFREYLEDHREEARANFAFGSVLVKENDERGIPYIKYALEMDPFLIPEGCRTVCEYYYRHGRHNEAHDMEKMAAQFEHEYADALEERQNLSCFDEYQPHTAPEAALSLLRAKFEQVGDIRQVYLAEKIPEHFSEKTVSVLAIVVDHPRQWRPDERKLLLQWLDFEGDLVMFFVANRHRRILKKIKQFDNALIYKREKQKN